MSKGCSEEFTFFPSTLLYPRDSNLIKAMTNNDTIQSQGQSASKTKSPKFYIVKPEASCQGKGIFLTKNLKKVLGKDTNYVIQEYLEKPYLIDGLKFDIRLYVVLKSLNPLSVYLFKEGLVRLCTEPYVPPNRENYKNMFVHLTNYAVNKENPKFVQAKSLDGENLSHKRSLSHFLWVFNYCFLSISHSFFLSFFHSFIHSFILSFINS